MSRRCRHEWDVVEVNSVTQTRPVRRDLVCSRCGTTRPVGETRVEQWGADTDEFPFVVWCDECNLIDSVHATREEAQHYRDHHERSTEYHHV